MAPATRGGYVMPQMDDVCLSCGFSWAYHNAGLIHYCPKSDSNGQMRRMDWDTDHVWMPKTGTVPDGAKPDGK